jgi:site-specific DNA-methyltransferase (adenine-specific)
MFPPQIASVFIQWLSEPGDAIYDPFSGRGTVALEAVLHRRLAYASDANPLAVALTAAKVDIPSRSAVERRLRVLEADYSAVDLSDVPADIQMLYSDGTLSQIVYLKDRLSATSHVDRFLRAMVLGLLHGNHSAGGATRGFSISMPNTFAMAPGYVRRFIETHELEAPDVDVFAMLRTRSERMSLAVKRVRGGRAWSQDAIAAPPEWLKRRKAKLVLTSPPYLQVIKYGKYNWVRLWFLGADPKATDDALVATASLHAYREFMRRALENAASVLRDDGFLCLVVGDVRRGGGDFDLASDLWESVCEPNGWHLRGVVVDRVPRRHKVSRIWKHSRGRATNTDRILILCRGRQSQDLPKLGRIRWAEAALTPTELPQEVA